MNSSIERTALLLMAHGSRRAEANEDLRFVAEKLRERGCYSIVQISYLELAEPTIFSGGESCVRAGATNVIMLPYFLSPGVHVRDDMNTIKNDLCQRYPLVRFCLAEPLGRHPLLIDVVEQRAEEAMSSFGQTPRIVANK